MQRVLTNTEREALARFKGALVPLLGDNLVSVWLFGSRARGEGTSGLDLGVLIVLRRKDVATCRVIVEAARGWHRRGLLLPDLEGVDTVEEQIRICRLKAGIAEEEPIKLMRFEVARYK